MRRGVGHVEMVIAFVLFIMFLIFGLYFFNPINTTRVLDSTLYYATTSILEKSTTTTYRYSIKIPAGGAQSSARLVKVSFRDLEVDPTSFRGIRVDNSLGRALPVINTSNDFSFSRDPSSASANTDSNGAEQDVGDLSFVRFVFGDFETDYTTQEIVGNVVPLTARDFLITSSDVKETISQDSLEAIATQYSNEYVGLKEEFNLPKRVDFSFKVLSGTSVLVEATRPIPEQVEVYTKNQRIELVRSDGKTEFVDLIVSVW